jgi:thymidylate synthase (FAD)
VRKQSSSNRQGGDEKFVSGGGAAGEGPAADGVKTAQAFLDYLAESEALYQKYLKLTEEGVSRELARIGLPVSLYTEWYWKIDLHNLLRFLSLRMDSHAQEEIRVFATAMFDLIRPIVPHTVEAFEEDEMHSVRLSRLEVEALRSAAAGQGGALASDNKREQAEWEAKRKMLGM